MTRNEVRGQLDALADEKYREFHKKLCPGTDNILGVRVPMLRKLAKEIAKGNWRAYLEEAAYDYQEEAQVAGMVIGFAKTDIEEKLQYVAGFVPHIDTWAICDIFTGGLKDIKKNRERVFGFLQPYLDSDKEFDVRFAVVTLMEYYTDEEYLPRLFAIYDAVEHEGYYVKMGVAWAVSLCFVRFPQQTMAYLKRCRLDGETYRMALQKIVDSGRVDEKTKDVVRGMRKRETMQNAEL